MKEYPSIPGWKNSPLGRPCIAFDKLDGSNIRCEWHHKRGWGKYGSRKVLLDPKHEVFGEAITLFEATLAEPLEKVFKENRKLPDFEEATVYLEFYGKHSMFGQHMERDQKTLTIIDVNLSKRGIVLPRDFIKWFGHLPIPKVVYDGNFNQSFIQDVRAGRYSISEDGTSIGEGVVAKGVRDGAKSAQHRLWMAKVKTNFWMAKLGWFAKNNVNLQRLYEENIREQQLEVAELTMMENLVKKLAEESVSDPALLAGSR